MIDLNQVNVIDNFIPLHFQNHLFKKFTDGYKWKISGLDRETSYPNDESKYSFIHKTSEIHKTTQEYFQFTNTTLNAPYSFLDFGDIDPIHLSHYTQIYFNYLYNVIPTRIKSNLQVPTLNPDKTFHNSPHTDTTTITPNSYTLIYYVNDSDGDSIIFNEILNNSPIKDFTIDKKITPKKGRAVIFPSNRFHCGSNPVDTRVRIVINYNFKLIPL